MTWSEIERLDVGNWGEWKDSKFKGTRPALLEMRREGRTLVIQSV